jgi:sterol desaturase/sphingolipid hydroxylase (fatty acid hydroxylase superfamily)
MQKLLNLLLEMEFYLKVAISCAIFQQLFYWILHDIEVNFIAQLVFYWLVGSVSFYAIGLFIEKVLKKNDDFRVQRNTRTKKVKKQPYPAFTAKGIVFGEFKSLIAALIILYLAPEVHRGNGLVLNLGWFLMRIMAADFCFYVTHWLFHRIFLQKIHLKHHEFADSSSFVAGHKSLGEYIIVTITERDR